MKRNKLIFLFLLIAIAAIYFLLFQKDKTLQYIPANADAIVVIDVKNLSRQYIYAFANHPSQWFKDKKEGESKFSFKSSGLKIPDFIQVFHLKNTGFSQWYSVLEIKDQVKFVAFLDNKKFTKKAENEFQKDNIFLKIEGEYCIFGTADKAFGDINNHLKEKEIQRYFNADQFMGDGIGSFSLVSEKGFSNFSIELNDDAIEIKKGKNIEVLAALISKIQVDHPFLEIELDKKNMENAASFFNIKSVDSSKIHYLKASATLKEVNDSIVTYDYDDDFNEIEKVAIQKIIQPNYAISLQSDNLEETWKYLYNKKWINDKSQFTLIPFQPNLINKQRENILIKSTKNPVELSNRYEENFIFIKNDPLVLKSFNSFTKNEKDLLSNLDYIFFGNKSDIYYLKLKMKKGDLPLILR
ncbi:hypothetical protein [Frigoriflavimonas asaccharolytica]|uniref:DUF4340 domain-containing protein n=1 Tax=Frigoriflavimonas asaccharolytica TaxID=2735899 RepID=A0A8J8G995_9FLAO|nr:hypothetical protein [Frigoriflavimonas asaccharolytica]NRS93671.1 hypothetical protein [Frigoriflavimonas asaccharolytica]